VNLPRIEALDLRPWNPEGGSPGVPMWDKREFSFWDWQGDFPEPPVVTIVSESQWRIMCQIKREVRKVVMSTRIGNPVRREGDKLVYTVYANVVEFQRQMDRVTDIVNSPVRPWR
jgi:hypothetical protein